MDTSLISIFASIALIQIIGWLSPGPNLVAISGASMSSGRRVGLATAAGVASGVTLWAAMAVFGVALLFEALPALFIALKIAGALFLLWMGWQYIQAARHLGNAPLSAKAGPADVWPAYRNGFLVLMTNPKAPIFFGAVLTSFLPAGAPAWVMSGIVIEFLVMSLILNSITALLFSTVTVMAWFATHQTHIRYTFGAIFIVLAALVMKDALTL
ncbi:MAG: LysE family transporter [Paracoccaceae bacterium]